MKFFGSLLICAVLLSGILLADAKPTIYMKNGNDKLEPLLVPVSSTVIPIPAGHYQVSAGFGVKPSSKYKKQNMKKLTKPDGPIKLITVSGLKKMADEDPAKP